MDQVAGKRIVRVCWEYLAEDPEKTVFKFHFRRSFKHIPEVVGHMESEWVMFCGASPGGCSNLR